MALLNGDTVSLRRTRRRDSPAEGMEQAWSVAALSSFHLSALALERITSGMGLSTTMHAVFDGAAHSSPPSIGG